MARAHDYDEFHQEAMVHSASGIIPACLAVRKWSEVYRGDLSLRGSGNGFDGPARLSLEEVPWLLEWRAVLTWGLRDRLAAGKLLRLDHTELLNALGIAYSQVSGTVLPSIEGSLMVHIQIGMTSHAGILSALLAQRGSTGPRYVQGKFGYFPVLVIPSKSI